MNNKRFLTSIVCFTVMAVQVFAQSTTSMAEKDKDNIPQYSYSVEEMDKVSDYIKQQYGEFDIVAHELVSPDIHCDIAIVPPTDDQPYYKLVTMGAGAFKMNVPEDLKSDVYERAEYVVFLPADWNIKSDKEEDYWPIRMLKTVARLPVSMDDWLFYRHTVNLTDDESPVAENTGFNSCVLFISFGKGNKPVEPLKLDLSDKEVAFFQLVPLYPEELEFKLEHSFDELEDIMDDDLYDPVVDIHRENYCK
ncbi:MAG: suppressor of fused domain protein [Prevotella sp.]|nr:suppressor of fused domain protein [Prevotella sp.]